MRKPALRGVATSRLQLRDERTPRGRAADENVHRVSIVADAGPIVVKDAAVAAKTEVSTADRSSIAVLRFAKN